MQIEVIHETPVTRQKVSAFVRTAIDELGITANKVIIDFTSNIAEEEYLDGIPGVSFGYLLHNRLKKGLIEIKIHPGINSASQAVTICHELIHVKQLLTGQLKAAIVDVIDTTGNAVTSKSVLGKLWEDKFYPDDTPYNECPWEIEAKKHELPLCQKVFGILG